jgi:hypothetical protein
MTQEKKQLLLQDLCARLPYGVKLRYVEDLVVKKESHIITLNNIYLEHIINGDADIKPYLRPMSSMTREEEAYWNYHRHVVGDGIFAIGRDNPTFCIFECFEWLNSHHFDYGGLIYKGLALEAPEDMYK